MSSDTTSSPPGRDLQIRAATDADVEAVRELFTRTYGEAYPFKQFYDTTWLKKAVFDDDTAFIVAERGGGLVGTVSIMLSAGSLSDLIGEFGRLVVDPQARGASVGSHLVAAAIEEVSAAVRFGFAEGRTAHPGSQKILERSGFAAVGFEPLKYKLGERESMVLYGRLFGDVHDLRRNNPRLIPEVAPLAMHALAAMGLAPDVVVVDDEDGYPDTPPDGVEVEDLSEQGWSPLLRIERGRVKDRDVFGNLSLSHGFFKIKDSTTRYLVARRGAAVVGGLGFTHDPTDQKVRIFELIGFSDDVKGLLLREAQRIAEDELAALYVEADVSAYAPAIQRTLERMGFLAVAYCPSMVFEDVERLDVVRMARLLTPYFREDIPLTDAAGEVRNLVEKAMADRRIGARIGEAALHSGLFAGLEEGDAYHLARIAHVRRVGSAEKLIEEGARGDRVFVVTDGEVRVTRGGRELARLGAGETVGEMTLLDAPYRSADVSTVGSAEVVEILCADLVGLMDARPRLGARVMRNLATGLARKLRRIDEELGDVQD